MKRVKLFFNRLKGIHSRLANPGMSGCLRCWRAWKIVKGHITPYGDDGKGCFPLCVGCWDELGPGNRFPYYERLFWRWVREARESWGSVGVDLETIKTAVLAEETQASTLTAMQIEEFFRAGVDEAIKHKELPVGVGVIINCPWQTGSIQHSWYMRGYEYMGRLGGIIARDGLIAQMKASLDAGAQGMREAQAVVDLAHVEMRKWREAARQCVLRQSLLTTKNFDLREALRLLLDRVTSPVCMGRDTVDWIGAQADNEIRAAEKALSPDNSQDGRDEREAAHIARSILDDLRQYPGIIDLSELTSLLTVKLTFWVGSAIKVEREANALLAITAAEKAAEVGEETAGYVACDIALQIRTRKGGIV